MERYTRTPFQSKGEGAPLPALDSLLITQSRIPARLVAKSTGHETTSTTTQKQN